MSIDDEHEFVLASILLVKYIIDDTIDNGGAKKNNVHGLAKLQLYHTTLLIKSPIDPPNNVNMPAYIFVPTIR